MFIRTLMLITLMASLPLRAAQNLGEAAADFTVTFILSPPLIVETETPDVFGGIMVDAVDRLATTCGLKARFVNSPSWSRAQSAVKSGVMDALMPTNWSEDRLQHYHFPFEPIYKSEMTVMTLKSYGYTGYSGVEIFKGKRVGKLDNALISPAVDAYFESGNVTLSERASVLALFENLVRGRIDFVVGDVLSAIHYTRQIDIWDKVQVLDPPIGAIPQYLALSKASPLFSGTGTKTLHCLLNTPQNADGDARGEEVYRKKSK